MLTYTFSLYSDGTDTGHEEQQEMIWERELTEG